MSKVTLDSTWRSALNGLNESLELCDESGKTVGRFLPEEAYSRLLYALAQSQVSDEEIRKLRSQTGGRALSEIWQDIKQP